MYQWGQTAASNGLTVAAAAEIIMEQWQNDNWQGRTKMLGVKPLQSHFVLTTAHGLPWDSKWARSR